MMRCLPKVLTVVLFLTFAIIRPSFCQDVGITQLVDKYKNDTDIQRSAVEKEYLGRTITVSGMVSDVRKENTFDVVNDVKRHYYKVITNVENTPAGNPYRAVLIYKDISKVKNIDKGQKISFSGNIIRVVNERLYLSVWLSADQLTAQEKELFK